MADRKRFTITLVGNPNSGKSSVFNHLTGLHQKTGNFPGVTVEKKEGTLRLPDGSEALLIDLPGAYSLYPNAQDERMVVQTLTDVQNPDYPDALVYVADVTRLEKHLLLFSQLCDLRIPLVLALNMYDIAEHEGLQVDAAGLARFFGVSVVAISGRTGQGMDELRHCLQTLRDGQATAVPSGLYKLTLQEQAAAQAVKNHLPEPSDYHALLVAHHHAWLPFLHASQRANIAEELQALQFASLKNQVDETLKRYDAFLPVVRRALHKGADTGRSVTAMLDQVLTHRIAGPLIFFLLMALVFQSIYAWAQYPMDWIDSGFGLLGDWLTRVLPPGWLHDLLVKGLLAGLGGIMVFVPQIAILFFLISLLEEVGYLARAAFIFDRLMRWFGLNGRSIVSLISGGACAIPAIMGARTISSWKERLITILVTPFISCSARIPVYTALIGFVVPPRTVWGFLNAQGLAFMGLYLLGIMAALLSGWLLKQVLRSEERSFLMLELPQYRRPVLRNVGLTVWEKVRTFVVEAGKIILVISLVLWVLSSYGPPGKMQMAEAQARATATTQQLDEIATEDLVAAQRLEASWAGWLGKKMEPAIRPLGFDWKMGIALIMSFAAREVFVGTMATIYSIGSVQDDENSIRQRMARERNPITGLPVYTMATALSLLIFYVFAMQCMSTLAVVRRETGSWKWPLLQFAGMTGLAYLASLAVYQMFG